MEADTSTSLLTTALETLRDVVPIAVILVVFQVGVLRRSVPNLRRVVVGFAYVVAGLTLFVVGLESALFPLGRVMATQLTDPEFLVGAAGSSEAIPWWRYYWIYLFGAAIGFSTAIAEPSLMAVALKADAVSGATIRAWPLRVAVAIGAGASVAVSALRIVTGTPLYVFMIVGYAIVMLQTARTPKTIVPLAYDSGGVTTSTVTVPIVTAIGLGLASTVPGRSELVDGFGVIALAALFPLISVMGYAQIAHWRAGRGRARAGGAA